MLGTIFCFQRICLLVFGLTRQTSPPPARLLLGQIYALMKIIYSCAKLRSKRERVSINIQVFRNPMIRASMPRYTLLIFKPCSTSSQMIIIPPPLFQSFFATFFPIRALTSIFSLPLQAENQTQVSRVPPIGGTF